MQLMEDQDYRAEAERRGLPVGRAVGGAELQSLIAAQPVGRARAGGQGVSGVHRAQGG